MPIRRVDVQPLRKEHVDLMNVRLEGRIAGRVIRSVVGRAQTLAGFKRNGRGRTRGFTAGWSSRLGTLQQRGTVMQCPQVVLGQRQKQSLQRMGAERVKND